MPISAYLAGLRAKVGHDLILCPAAGAAVLDADDRLLLARHVDTGTWATVGGGIDPGESPAEAALRELAEETGLRGEIVGLIGAYGGPDSQIVYPGGDVVAYVVTMYACRLLSTDVHLQRDELDEIGWFTADDARRLPMRADMQRIVPDAFAWWAER